MVDFDALEAAGIANARERAALIEYLDGLGFTAEEMVDAERRGRLFGLAGDALQGPGRPIHSLRTAAEALGVPLDEVATAWAALGLTIADPEALALSQADVDGLATWVAIKALVGDEPALGFLRVLGSAMARVAEAGGTMVRMAQPDLLMAHQRRRTHHGDGIPRDHRDHPTLRRADRCRVPAAHRQRPNTFRGCHHRRVGECHVRRRIRRSDRLHRN